VFIPPAAPVSRPPLRLDAGSPADRQPDCAGSPARTFLPELAGVLPGASAVLPRLVSTASPPRLSADAVRCSTDWMACRCVSNGTRSTERGCVLA
jgi:hypothetical protein